MTGSAPSTRRRAPLFALAVASTLGTLLFLECAVRVCDGQLLDLDHRIVADRGRWSGDYAAHDPDVGWIPRPGIRVRGEALGWQPEAARAEPGIGGNAVVTIVQDGLRSNGEIGNLPAHPVALAVGDSFTFGDQVSDAATWPAALERLMETRVLNAGVFAYGLDQSVLRAEQLAPRFSPDLLIVSFVPVDVRRTTVSARAKATKPYFDVVDERLVLRNRPVPPPEEDMDAFRRVFGYSHLADKLMNRIDPTYWQAGPVERAHDRGLVVSCLLMERLRRLGHARQMPVLVVAQPSKRGDLDTRVSDIVLGCARDAGLAALNLFPAFRGVRDESPGRYERFFFGHMTPSGNRFVAGQIAASIRRDALLD